MISGYKVINGISMYYEIYGSGKPLVLIHGGGSTIQTSFGKIIPYLSLKRKLICLELQAHGRTEDRESEITFEQDAEDVIGLLNYLEIQRADILGFSNGACTAIQIAIRHPHSCNKIIAASVLLKRNGAPSGFWEFMNNGTFDQMPLQYKNAFLEHKKDNLLLQSMYKKCSNRMINFKDFNDDELKNIKAPVLLLNAEHDVATFEHITAITRLLPISKLEIFPGGHGEYLGEITSNPDPNQGYIYVISTIENFLDN